MIPAIGAISSSFGATLPPIGSSTPSASTGTSSFGQILGKAIDSLQGTQATAATQAQQVATGQANLSNAMVASSESLLATQLVVALRNGAVSAINQVMSTQF
ncbi:MAG: flagellar hook-basal body complex protein FliE [Ferrimicrobium sp.]|jgi:flagellar hook-basal body complex protein FliE|uniref:Flagellar hook-basal body complex protein FliE n=1 Tax=Ferrimicrobium acidiphilum TaxID=121039 RepID=A0ABV3XZX7_9ACTN|nr:flagellar hook-basal body complex protein FliE [Ferrimicrobium sp.]MCL5974090.1 flagellar hook-basal body complex protein FliE [Actinomycetota bacterium]MDA8399660.1 flagellar hook-basal body complex protein FliE [Actinomycetota bacterium]